MCALPGRQICLLTRGCCMIFIETEGLRPAVFFKPSEVWEIRGAEWVVFFFFCPSLFFPSLSSSRFSCLVPYILSMLKPVYSAASPSAQYRRPHGEKCRPNGDLVFAFHVLSVCETTRRLKRPAILTSWLIYIDSNETVAPMQKALMRATWSTSNLMKVWMRTSSMNNDTMLAFVKHASFFRLIIAIVDLHDLSGSG
jgi:hypothetical protein